MTSTLWKQLCSRYGISIKFSSAHHLETDGQTESSKKVMKIYFWVYINHTQDDWVNDLLMAKFAASNHINASMGLTLFFADYGFHPQTGIEPLGTYKSEQKAKFLAADEIIRRQAKMIIFLQD